MSIVALLTIVKEWKQPNVSTDRQMGKENVVHTNNWILFFQAYKGKFCICNNMYCAAVNIVIYTPNMDMVNIQNAIYVHYVIFYFL